MKITIIALSLLCGYSYALWCAGNVHIDDANLYCQRRLFDKCDPFKEECVLLDLDALDESKDFPSTSADFESEYMIATSGVCDTVEYPDPNNGGWISEAECSDAVALLNFDAGKILVDKMRGEPRTKARKLDLSTGCVFDPVNGYFWWNDAMDEGLMKAFEATEKTPVICKKKVAGGSSGGSAGAPAANACSASDSCAGCTHFCYAPGGCFEIDPTITDPVYKEECSMVRGQCEFVGWACHAEASQTQFTFEILGSSAMDFAVNGFAAFGVLTLAYFSIAACHKRLGNVEYVDIENVEN